MLFCIDDPRSGVFVLTNGGNRGVLTQNTLDFSFCIITEVTVAAVE